jgi:uncharacterized protein (TIGR02301 family)
MFDAVNLPIRPGAAGTQSCRRPPSAVAVSSAVLAALIAVQPAQAQDSVRRPGADRAMVVQLAYVLGEAHALHRLCAGPADGLWYGRMQRLEAEEAADAASRRQLTDAFNAGFAARQAQFIACSRRSRQAEGVVAGRGEALARRLAGAADASP